VIFATRDFLNLAILRHTCLHIKVQDHTSVVCHKRFVHSGHLNVHMHTHTGLMYVIYLQRHLLHPVRLRSACLHILVKGHALSVSRAASKWVSV